MLSASYAYLGPVKCLLEKYQSNIGEKKNPHILCLSSGIAGLRYSLNSFVCHEANHLYQFHDIYQIFHLKIMKIFFSPEALYLYLY